MVYNGSGIDGLINGQTYYVNIQGTEFKPSDTVNASTGTIDLGGDHGYATGDAVVYQSMGTSEISGLENGRTSILLQTETLSNWQILRAMPQAERLSPSMPHISQVKIPTGSLLQTGFAWRKVWMLPPPKT